MTLQEFLAQSDRVFFEGQELRALIRGGEGLIWGEADLPGTGPDTGPDPDQQPLALAAGEGAFGYTGDPLAFTEGDDAFEWEYAA